MYALGTAALSAALLLASPADAFFRLVCPGRLVTERADPIISPGVVSGHVHQISGGSGFGFTEDYAQARAASCTSCPISADLSNYWTPILYFHAQNGSFIKVPEYGDSLGQPAGMNAYYLQRGPDLTALKAFPEGFRMVAGNPFKRNATTDFAGQAVSFACVDYNGPAVAETPGLPTYNCATYLRAQVFFPSCWDGVNLDSADHSSHMSYPESGAYNDGPCPASHPVQLVSLFYEVSFNVNAFVNDRWNDQPFVFAMGDATGYGFHGDFINGWDVDVLQNAVDTCDNDSGNIGDCPVFDDITLTSEESNMCQIPSQVDEDIEGPFDSLPGCNPVTYGPEEAVMVTDCAVTPISAPASNFVDLTVSKKWEYLGCGVDSAAARGLTGTSESSDTLTVESCVEFCVAAGYSYAGMEWADQCYCGNTLASTSQPQAGILGTCAYPCAGDSSEICGGYGAMSVYHACGSGSCSNAVWKAVGNSTVAAASSAVSSVASVASSAVSSAASSVVSAASSAVSGASSSASASVSASTSTTATHSTTATLSTSASTSGSSSSSSSSTAEDKVRVASAIAATSSSTKSPVTSTVTQSVLSTSTNAAGVIIVYETVTDYVTVTDKVVSTSTPNKRHRHHHAARHDF